MSLYLPISKNHPNVTFTTNVQYEIINHQEIFDELYDIQTNFSFLKEIQETPVETNYKKTKSKKLNIVKGKNIVFVPDGGGTYFFCNGYDFYGLDLYDRAGLRKRFDQTILEEEYNSGEILKFVPIKKTLKIGSKFKNFPHLIPFFPYSDNFNSWVAKGQQKYSFAETKEICLSNIVTKGEKKLYIFTSCENENARGHRSASSDFILPLKDLLIKDPYNFVKVTKKYIIKHFERERYNENIAQAKAVSNMYRFLYGK